MTTEEKNQKLIRGIAYIFDIDQRNVYHSLGGGHVDLDEDKTFSMQKLDDLALLIGHTNINIIYKANEEDYSEVTPGSPSQCSVVWHEDLEKLRRY